MVQLSRNEIDQVMWLFVEGRKHDYGSYECYIVHSLNCNLSLIDLIWPK